MNNENRTMLSVNGAALLIMGVVFLLHQQFHFSALLHNRQHEMSTLTGVSLWATIF